MDYCENCGKSQPLPHVSPEGRWMNLQALGIFMAGLGILITSELEVLNYMDMRSRRILCGRPAGTYEVNMDERF